MEFDLNKQISLLNRKLFNRKRSFENYSPIGLILSHLPDHPTLSQRKVKKHVSSPDDSFKGDHKFNTKKIQIVKLPKLPFGKHEVYNTEEPFVQKHFIDIEKLEKKNKDLSEAVKKFRLFKKKQNKFRQVSPDMVQDLNQNKKHYIYKTKGGVLLAEKDKNIINRYELSKKGDSSISSHRVLRRNNFSFIGEKSPKKSKSPVNLQDTKATATQMHEIIFFKFKSLRLEDNIPL
jgi:hypothetical protein